MEELLAHESSALGVSYAVIPLVGVLVCILCLAICRAIGRRPGFAGIAWMLPFVGILAFLALWCAKGLCEVELPLFVATSIFAGVSGCVAIVAHVIPCGARHKSSRSGSKALAEKDDNGAIAWTTAKHAKHVKHVELSTPVQGVATQDTTMQGTSVSACAFAVRQAHPKFFRLVAAFRTAALICVAAVACVAALECASNPTWTQIPLPLLALESLFALLVLAALFFFGQRHSGLAVVGVAAFAFVGIVEAYVVRFRASPIVPIDLLAIKTAAAVAEGYTYEIDNAMCLSIGFIIAALLALSLCRLPSAVPSLNLQKPSRGIVRGVVNIACAALLAVCAVGIIAIPDYDEDLGVEIDLFRPLNLYQEDGFLPSFVAHVQSMHLEEPQGYTVSQALELQEKLAQAYDQGMHNDGAASAWSAPSIVVVMNESYADLSIFEGLNVGYQGPWLVNGQDNAFTGGVLTVPTHAGGTCNTEFEFLTGNSLGIVGTGYMPFVQYTLGDVDSIVRQFAEQGYVTTGIHPYLPDNWSRKQRYLELGFEQTNFIESFEDAPTFRTFTSDAATYDFILNLLEADSRPQFIFEVTMQNHGGYDTGLLDAQDMHHYASTDYASDATANQINEYLTCLDESDKALQEFIGKLSKLKRPVILLFFGDHQPNLTRFVGETVFPDQSEIEESVRLNQAVYMMWANYDTGWTKQENPISACNLDIGLLEAADLPLSDYQKARAYLAKSIPQLGYACYQGANGTWYYYDDEYSPYAEQIQQLATIEYLHFGSRV